MFFTLSLSECYVSVTSEVRLLGDLVNSQCKPPIMSEVVLTVFEKMEILLVDTVEQEFRSSGDQSTLFFLRLAQFVTFGLILGANVPIIIFILKQGTKTFLDWLIVFDCFLCLLNLRVILALFFYRLLENNTMHSVFDADFCTCHVFLSYFTNVCNRLLSLGIVVYRITLVLGSSFLVSSNQKKVLGKIVMLAIILPSLILTGFAVYYRENNFYFLSNSNEKY